VGYGVPAGGELRLPACDDDYIDRLARQTADEILTPDAPHSLFHTRTVLGTTYFIFYLTEQRPHRKTIYFDLGELDRETHIVKIATAYHYRETAIKNVTFLTNGDVYFQNEAHRGLQDWGAEGDEQLVIMTSGSVRVTGTKGTMKGVVFRCGGFFYLTPGETHYVGGKEAMRVIADRSIYLYGGQGSPELGLGAWTDLGKWSADTEFMFGPPCPPAIVRLGRLIPTER
jgi:hypothetical protein